MKIIHCADLHLDSPLTSNLDRKKAAKRKNELLGTFTAMVEYAEEKGVRAVIIAGDLFDRNRVSASARNIVYGVMAAHPEVLFFYLRGNHDRNGGEGTRDRIPSNLRLFGREWTTYELFEGMKGDGRVAITGREFPEFPYTGRTEAADDPVLIPDPRCINIVVLHGELSQYSSPERHEQIDIRRLSNRNIDYLALGHLHEYRRGTLPPSGIYCYPGSLEGRGFDETGEHGFVLLDINTRTGRINDTFVPFARRRLYEIETEITGCLTTADIAGRMKEALQDAPCRQSDMVKFVLLGAVDVQCEKNMEYLEQLFRDSFYAVRVSDQSSLKVPYSDYELDISLKGELVRLMQEETEMPEEEKALIIRCALQALNEEEISL